MANAVYPKGREGFALAGVNWASDTIHVTLVDMNDYTLALSTDDFYSDIPSAARVATVALASKTATAGVLDAADATLTTVTGDQSEALVIWKNTGVETTSRLLMFIDTASGLPVTLNGGNVQVVWPSAGITTL